MHRHRTSLSLTLLFLLIGVAAQPDASVAQDNSAIPDWFTQHMEEMTQGNGRWIADNAAYKSDAEPYDAYGLEWTWGIGQKSLTGRLFAMQDDEELGTIWKFREVWHPGEQQVYLYQYGSDGTFGVGTVHLSEGNIRQSDQTFFNPDGTTFRSGHRMEIVGDEQRAQSFNIMPDGTWQERRSYVWKRDIDG